MIIAHIYGNQLESHIGMFQNEGEEVGRINLVLRKVYCVDLSSWWTGSTASSNEFTLF